MQDKIPFTDYIPPSWDVLFMRKVYEIASKSKDPRTKVGAVLVKNNHALLEGYNGIIKGVQDLNERLESPEKYLWIEHAERNVINMAANNGVSTNKGTLYTQGYPCIVCMRGIINSGMCELVLHKQWIDAANTIPEYSMHSDIDPRINIMIQESGIRVRILNAILDKTAYLAGFKISV